MQELCKKEKPYIMKIRHLNPFNTVFLLVLFILTVSWLSVWFWAGKIDMGIISSTILFAVWVLAFPVDAIISAKEGRKKCFRPNYLE